MRFWVSNLGCFSPEGFSRKLIESDLKKNYKVSKYIFSRLSKSFKQTLSRINSFLFLPFQGNKDLVSKDKKEGPENRECLGSTFDVFGL
jgi:hypothetical protein